MNAAACLIAYSAAVLAFGPPVLIRLTGTGHAPRYGVAAWLGAVGSVLLTWLAVAALLAVDVAAHWNQRSSFVRSCVELLCRLASGDAGRGAQLAVLAGLAAAGAAVVYLGVRISRTISRLRAHAHAHARAVRLVGRPSGERDVYIVEAPERAAYCVSGRPSTIVVTSAALAALDRDELSAVLAHERAHLIGHHPAVVTTLRGLATVFARLTLMTQAAREVSRLLEMCADDTAARRHGQHTLVHGLMALVGAAPVGALGAADVAVLTRAQRLLSPPAHGAHIGIQVLLAAAVTIFMGAPVGMVILDAAGLLPCS